jgi:Ankyrin repeats (3 copies)/Ankyrin repeat
MIREETCMLSRRIATSAVLLLFTAIVAAAQATEPDTKADQLSAAARRGDAATVKKLLDDGVDPNTKFRYGVTALTWAADHGHLEVVKLLVDHGADINVKDTFYGSTPLMLAIDPAQKKKPEHTEIARLLIAKGAKDKDQALSSAASDGDTVIVKAVLDTGTVPAPVLSDALESAKAKNKTDVVALLEQAGAKPYDDFKIEATQLASYAGTYRNAGGNTFVFTVAGSRLSGGPPGQNFVLSAIDATKFRVIGMPAVSVVFQVSDGKVTGVAVTQGPNTTNFTRVEGK